MKPKDKIFNFFKSSYDDLVFQNRNQEYGAYQLRIVSRLALSVGFISTTILSITGLKLLSYKPNTKTENNVKIVNFEVFDPKIKLQKAIIEPAEGNPNAASDNKVENVKSSENKTSNSNSQSKNITIVKHIEDHQKKQNSDSMAKAKSDSINSKKNQDSLASIANNEKLGVENGKGIGIDTTHYKPIGGDDDFAIWVSQILKDKYTPRLKAYGRKITFTLGYNVNSDSTITNFKIYQKALFDMDDVIIKTLEENPKKMIPYKNERGEIIKSQPVKRSISLLP